MVERILVAEQSGCWLQTLARPLADTGSQVEFVTDSASALRKVQSISYSLILLDLMNGGRDGVSVCKAIRETRDVPIIVVTTRRDEETMLAAFAAGADDYLTAPFEPRELIARVRAVLRRYGASRSGTQQCLHLGEMVIDCERHELVAGDERIALREREFALLVALARRRGAVVSRADLLDAVWGDAGAGDPRKVDACMAKLRRIVAHTPIRIETVWGIGYRLVM